ncbi:MAG: hypothetical protein B5M48_03210 [Candidatus Omnitrophica bacterium 4484_213]|nr:MAG: hypothetical protein B5M48_03210 [Candidatus Omnitrophica bacterium 4484_213]
MQDTNKSPASPKALGFPWLPSASPRGERRVGRAIIKLLKLMFGYWNLVIIWLLYLGYWLFVH